MHGLKCKGFGKEARGATERLFSGESACLLFLSAKLTSHSLLQMFCSHSRLKPGTVRLPATLPNVIIVLNKLAELCWLLTKMFKKGVLEPSANT